MNFGNPLLLFLRNELHISLVGCVNVIRNELIERLRSAATLYRGNFLDGFSLPDAPDFDDWVRFQRERWHHQMEELFDRLTQAQEEAGEVAGVVKTARGWRRYAPLNEQVYLRLMRSTSLLATGVLRCTCMQTAGPCSQQSSTPCRLPKPRPWPDVYAARLHRALAPSPVHLGRAARRHLFWKAPPLGEMPSTRHRRSSIKRLPLSVSRWWYSLVRLASARHVWQRNF